MESKLSPIELLDKVLYIFDSSSKHIGMHRIQIKDLLEARGIILIDGLLTEMLFKIEKDGFLRHELGDVQLLNQKVKDIPFYILTFEGELMQLSGGYAQKSKNDEYKNIRLEKIESAAKANRKTVTFLTWIIAAGTLVAAVYYAIEILKHFSLIK